jgi:hypothetical protein
MVFLMRDGMLKASKAQAFSSKACAKILFIAKFLENFPS